MICGKCMCFVISFTCDFRRKRMGDMVCFPLAINNGQTQPNHVGLNLDTSTYANQAHNKKICLQIKVHQIFLVRRCQSRRTLNC